MARKEKSDKYISRSKSFTISDFPSEQRPRERLRMKGADKLSDAELLAIIIGSGVQGENVIITAQKLLSKFGSLNGVLEASFEDIKSIRGFGNAKASQLIACFEIARRVRNKDSKREDKKQKEDAVTSPEEAFKLIGAYINDYSKENFLVLSFDVRNKLIGVDNISKGTISASLVHPRETFESAIRKHAAQIMIGHNHPSGSIEPSEDDIKITKRISEAGKIMGIELMDHIIVTKNNFYSFKSNGLL
ncbi:MAG: DNA repair protein RadC [Ignavibacteria bacterium]|nr:DNA repair protein RadC [Bacteroidota bacterium]MBL7129736.1 DNA repair protein RadC [Ignavibacteria bacterium]